MKKISVFIGSRANYSSIKSVLKSIQESSFLKLQLIVGASSVLERYGAVSELIEQDGFEISDRVYMLVEGESPLTMAKSTGLGIIELASTFSRLKPDIVLTIGDRFETMSTTIAASYMNIPLAHTMGGEVTGTIDESIRHAVTKFSHIHFAASKDAKQRIIKLGEVEENVYLVGCPRIDEVSNILNSGSELDDSFMSEGVGPKIDLDKPFVLVSQHPVTSEYGSGEVQIINTLEAVASVGTPAIVLWPNPDAGSSDISRGMRKWREENKDAPMHFFKNLPIEIYVKLMAKCACLVGNSSSGIREGAFIGTPVVNVGTRQDARERGRNVIDVRHNVSEIVEAMIAQIKHGQYIPEYLYGDGKAASKIVAILETCDVSTQKKITY